MVKPLFLNRKLPDFFFEKEKNARRTETIPRHTSGWSSTTWRNHKISSTIIREEI